MACTVRDARSIVEHAVVSHDYETLRVFLEAGFPVDATVGITSDKMPYPLGMISGRKVVSVPLIVMAFYPEARPTLLMSHKETRTNQVNVIRLLLSHGASIDRMIERDSSVFDFMLCVKPEKTTVLHHAYSLRYEVLKMLLYRDLLGPPHFAKLVTSYASNYSRATGESDGGDIKILRDFISHGTITGRNFESWIRGGRGVDEFPWIFFGLVLLDSVELAQIVFNEVNQIESFDSKRLIARNITEALVWQCNYGSTLGFPTYSVYSLLESCASIDHTISEQRYEFYSGMQSERHRLFEWIVLYTNRRIGSCHVGPIILDNLRDLFSRLRHGNRNLFVPAFVRVHCDNVLFRKLNILYHCVEYGNSPDIMYREQRDITEYLFSLALQWELHPEKQYRGSNFSTRESMSALWKAVIIANIDNPSGFQLHTEIISRISMFFLIGTFGFSMRLICPRQADEW